MRAEKGWENASKDQTIDQDKPIFQAISYRPPNSMSLPSWFDGHGAQLCPLDYFIKTSSK